MHPGTFELSNLSTVLTHINQKQKIQTFLSNCIRLISPNTIISTCKYVCSGPYGVQGVGEVLINLLFVTPVLLTIWFSSCSDNHRKNTTCIFPSKFRTITLVSPLCLGLLFENTQPLLLLIKRCYSLITNRIKPDSSVIPFISSLIQNGRMKRMPRYDIYLPHVTSNIPRIGLIIIPGFLVPHASYASVAHRLSNQGFIIVILSLEPCRIPISAMGANNKYIQQIIQNISKQYNVPKWNIGGHSAGGYSAMEIFAKNAQSNKKKHIHFENLLMLGCGNAKELLTDLSFISNPFQILVIEASEDPLAKFTNESRDMLQSLTPNQNVQFCRIKGGNHGGFAEYPDLILDGTRKISLEEQHDIISTLTFQFLYL